MTIPIKFANYAFSTLAVGCDSAATSLSVPAGHGARFPALAAGEYFYATLENAALNREIVKVTARVDDTLTVLRAQDNTTARSWNAGDSVSLRVNAAAFADVADAANHTYTPAGTGAVATTVQSKLREMVSVSDKGAVTLATINAALAEITDGTITINPGEYEINGDVLIQSKNGASAGAQGSLRIVAEGVRFTGTGSIIVDSCKRLTIVGLDAPDHDLRLRGCWWSSFDGMRFRRLIFSDVAGVSFTSNYWCMWSNCQFQTVITGAASTYNNKHDWYSCSMRGNTGQGFDETRDYAFEFRADANAQSWVYWGGDVSYHNTAIYYVAATNTADIELEFNGTYFDTFTPVPISRAQSRVATKNCHFANTNLNEPHSASLPAIARGGQDFFRQDRAAAWAQFSGINFIPNGDFRVGLPAYNGTGLPIGSGGGATITEASGGIFGRYLNINQANLGTSGIVRFRPRALPFTGRYTAVLLIRNAAAGTRTIRIGFNSLFQPIEISNTDWKLWTLTVGADIAAGAQPEILIRADDEVSTFNVDVCYAAVTFGEGGMPMALASPYVELIGSATYNPPSLATGTVTSTTLTVNGAALGDFVVPSFGIDLQGIQIWAQVTAANTVTVFLRNETGGTIDLASSTLRVRVLKATYV